MIVTITILLEEYCPSGNKGGISGDGKLLFRVWVAKDRCSGEFILDTIEGSLLFISPKEGGVLFGEIDEWASEVRELGNELPIEIAETKERANIAKLSWDSPF